MTVPGVVNPVCLCFSLKRFYLAVFFTSVRLLVIGAL